MVRMGQNKAIAWGALKHSIVSFRMPCSPEFLRAFEEACSVLTAEWVALAIQESHPVHQYQCARAQQADGSFQTQAELEAARHRKQAWGPTGNITASPDPRRPRDEPHSGHDVGRRTL
ncbi:hypothetical protein DQ04_04981000 [Trypanosoma grayi]|uniref:hypothetical protein n=1 Tax=Trypanosoma grayi TaxID=71804 RepID=UPI0004F437ED|nr:hypothetical protein DQ04_04981000 [Trypanosoma grayi]KEG09586.1 hypothetical protein DQ04_04981000 [Trypanosoma grayi]